MAETPPRKWGRRWEAGPRVNPGSEPPARASLSHRTSLTAHKFKGKIIWNFKMATTVWGPLEGLHKAQAHEASPLPPLCTLHLQVMTPTGGKKVGFIHSLLNFFQRNTYFPKAPREANEIRETLFTVISLANLGHTAADSRKGVWESKYLEFGASVGRDGL